MPPLTKFSDSPEPHSSSSDSNYEDSSSESSSDHSAQNATVSNQMGHSSKVLMGSGRGKIVMSNDTPTPSKYGGEPRNTATIASKMVEIPSDTFALSKPTLNSAELELQTANDLATQAEKLPTKPTKYMSELIAQPRVRGVFLRPGKVLKINRKPNQDAALGFTRGEKAEPACTSCKTGCGPFTECIVVPNMYKGSCTNCHYGSEGVRCSFRFSNLKSVTIYSRSKTSVPQSGKAPPLRLQPVRPQSNQWQSVRSLPIQSRSRRSQIVQSAKETLGGRRLAKVSKHHVQSVSLPVRSVKDIHFQIGRYHAAIARLHQELADMAEDIEEDEQDEDEV